MGYKYSSSTPPSYAFKYGPMFKRFGLLEFPLSGVFSKPLVVQDSWSFYADLGRKWKPEDFLAETKALVRFCQKKKLAGILNYYADPSHIWNQSTFFETVKKWKEIAEPIELRELCVS
jgi:hypothetical protein